jgi:hypothetical protein
VVVEMRRFLNDEAGQTTDDGLITWIRMVILVLVAIVLFKVSAPALTDSLRKIVDCIKCLMDPTCTSC